MVMHLVVRPLCPKSRLRDGGKWGRKGRLKAGSGLCELGSPSHWPPWRRCFCVRQDDRDALPIAPKLIGAVEAGAFMESIMVNHGACCSEPPTSSPKTRIAVLVDFTGKIIAPLWSVAPNCASRARLSHGLLC